MRSGQLLLKLGGDDVAKFVVLVRPRPRPQLQLPRQQRRRQLLQPAPQQLNSADLQLLDRHAAVHVADDRPVVGAVADGVHAD